MAYDLSAREVFTLLKETRGEHTLILKHVFRQPTFEDWLNYFKGTASIGYSKGRDTIEIATQAQQLKDAEFWDSLIVRVEGYRYQGKPIEGVNDWKALIPLTHKVEAVKPFFIFVREESPVASAVTTDYLDLASDVNVELQFSAVFCGNLVPIKIVFRQPTADEYIAYSRVASRMQLVRTKQRNVSLIKVPMDIRPLVELFDNLVVRVEGYTWNGEDVMKQSDWKSKLNAYHKREAVRELFTSYFASEEEVPSEEGF